MRKALLCLFLLASPAAAQFGPMQSLFRDRVQSFAGTLDVHGVASGSVVGPGGVTTQYTTDQHVSGTLSLPTFNALIGAWQGTLAGTITVSEQAVISIAGCTITNTFSASTSANVDYLGQPLLFNLSLDLGSDTWSLWPSSQYVNGTETSVSTCGGTTMVTQAMSFMQIDLNLHFPFPASPPPFDLIGVQSKLEPSGGNAASNPVTYTFTYNLAATTYPCNPALSVSSRDFSSRASSGSVGVNIGPSCPWTVTLPASWVNVTSPLSGSGPGTVSFSVVANTGADRSTTMDIAGVTFTINQGGPGYFTVAPCRVVDTRRADGPLGGPALQPAATRTFDVLAGSCNIPPTAMAVSANVAVTNPTAGGHLTVYPGDATPPLASTINFTAGQTRANNAILMLASDGSGTIKVLAGTGGTVDLILDVNGYFQ